jgi:hypothetical protein
MRRDQLKQTCSKEKRKREKEGPGVATNSFRVFELFIIISNAYETFKKIYDVVFNNTFKKIEMKRIQWHFFFSIRNFLNIQK